MGKKRLSRFISVSCLALFIATFSSGGIAAPVASAAVYNYQSNVYSNGVFSNNEASKARATVSYVGGRKVLTTYNAVPVRFIIRQPAPQLPTATNPAPAPVPQPNPPAQTGGEQQQAFNLLNADRAANGLPPLRLSSELSALAGDYAQDMINRKFFSHTNPEGQSPFDRMNQRNIRYGYAGENLAINSSVATAENAFMNSPGHRANILNSHYTQVGLGVRHSANGSVYVVQEFTDG